MNISMTRIQHFLILVINHESSGGIIDILGRRFPRFSGQTSSSSLFEFEDLLPANENPDCFFRRFKRAVKGIGIPRRTMKSFLA